MKWLNSTLLPAGPPFVINEKIRTVSGLSYREDKYETETYLNGEGSNYLFRVFANAEYSPVSLATMNAGAMFEDDTDNGEYISPRFALNIHLTDFQTLRFLFPKLTGLPTRSSNLLIGGIRRATFHLRHFPDLRVNVYLALEPLQPGGWKPRKSSPGRSVILDSTERRSACGWLRRNIFMTHFTTLSAGD